jgi:serine-type D-Ala-D-Ala carboxypeptidase (penicillin-binding protein 5/6)
MSERLVLLQEGRSRRAASRARARRARRLRTIRYGLLALAVGVAALLVFMAQGTSGPASHTVRPPARSHAAAGAVKAATGRADYGVALAKVQVPVRLKKGLKSGMLFDVRTGKVLWDRNPDAVVPIASLTKMMTALVVADHSRPNERVLITRAATHFSGSGIGLLPLHKKVPLEALLYGLMLPSGNDAAIALAQHVAGNQARFVGMMNARAKTMGLHCTHFTSVSGIIDEGNHSCAPDLAVLAHAILTRRRLARIVATRNIVLPFPIKSGHLWLYNNNPLLRLGYPGTDGVKTGYTVAAGPCLVAAARRGHKWLGVVLLHSDDPPDQAMKLLGAGFATRGA